MSQVTTMMILRLVEDIIKNNRHSVVQRKYCSSYWIVLEGNVCSFVRVKTSVNVWELPICEKMELSLQSEYWLAAGCTLLQDSGSCMFTFPMVVVSSSQFSTNEGAEQYLLTFQENSSVNSVKLDSITLFTYFSQLFIRFCKNIRWQLLYLVKNCGLWSALYQAILSILLSSSFHDV